MAKRNLIFLSLVGLIIVGSGVYVLLREHTTREPQIVVEVLEGNLISSSVFELSKGELSKIDFTGEGTVISRSRSLDLGVIVSAVRLLNQIGTILIVETESSSDIVSGASSVKDAVSLSPFGAFIAFSELALPLGSTLYSENISDWNVVLLDSLTEAQTVVGSGFKPFVLSEQPLRVLYSTAEGIMVHDVSANEMFNILSDRPIISTRHAATLSPDGTHLASYNPITKTFSIFSLSGEFPYMLSSVGEPPRSFETVSLSNDALYGIARNESNNEFTLWRYPFKNFVEPAVQGELLYTFEPGQLPNAIIP